MVILSSLAAVWSSWRDVGVGGGGLASGWGFSPHTSSLMIIFVVEE